MDDDFLRKAAAATPISTEKVYDIYVGIISMQDIKRLCESHERLRMELEAAMKVAKEINDMMATVNGVGSVS